MRSWMGRQVSGARLALELGLAACTLCLVVENALLLFVLGHGMEWPQSLLVAKAAAKTLAALAESALPLAAASLVAVLVLGALLLALRSTEDAREVNHA